jgi:deoxyribose-phosphate aldolase
MSTNKQTDHNIAKFIDHTNVKVDSDTKSIKKTCLEAIKYGFHSVCVTPYRVAEAKRYLGKNKNIELIAVIGFPFGFTTTNVKSIEAQEAVKNGATEIDMVININAIKDKDWKYVENDISQVVKSSWPCLVKVILEPGYLSESELIQACLISKKAGARYVKTATGYGLRGAIIKDIDTMKKTIGDQMEIKASGGINDLKTALLMIKHGANRIGTSSGLEIIGAKKNNKKSQIKTKKTNYNY